MTPLQELVCVEQFKGEYCGVRRYSGVGVGVCGGYLCVCVRVCVGVSVGVCGGIVVCV